MGMGLGLVARSGMGPGLVSLLFAGAWIWYSFRMTEENPGGKDGRVDTGAGSIDNALRLAFGQGITR